MNIKHLQLLQLHEVIGSETFSINADNRNISIYCVDVCIGQVAQCQARSNYLTKESLPRAPLVPRSFKLPSLLSLWRSQG